MPGAPAFPYPYSEFKVFKVDPKAMQPTHIETRGVTLDIAVFNDEPGATTGVEDFRPGDEVECSLWVCRRGDEPTGPAFVYEDAFADAAFLEAYLVGSPPVCELAAYEFCVLGAPSEQPVLTLKQLEEEMAN